MLDTGFPQADAENDFLRARRHQVLATLAHRLRHHPAGSNRLIPLDEVIGTLGSRAERRLGLQTIPLDTIVGTVDSRRDFDRRFRPTTNRVRPRWERLALAQRHGEPIPPIEVYRVGGQHFVSDGHHRVSVAAATGQPVIDAYVTEILTAGRPAARTAKREQRRNEAEAHRTVNSCTPAARCERTDRCSPEGYHQTARRHQQVRSRRRCAAARLDRVDPVGRGQPGTAVKYQGCADREVHAQVVRAEQRTDPE
jgi:hypothetical protein